MKEARGFVEKRVFSHNPLCGIGGRSCDEIVDEGSQGSPRRGLKSNKRKRNVGSEGIVSQENQNFVIRS